MLKSGLFPTHSAISTGRPFRWLPEDDYVRLLTFYLRLSSRGIDIDVAKVASSSNQYGIRYCRFMEKTASNRSIWNLPKKNKPSLAFYSSKSSFGGSWCDVIGGYALQAAAFGARIRVTPALIFKKYYVLARCVEVILSSNFAAQRVRTPRQWEITRSESTRGLCLPRCILYKVRISAPFWHWGTVSFFILHTIYHSSPNDIIIRLASGIWYE